jgi:hypothetical protein
MGPAGADPIPLTRHSRTFYESQRPGHSARVTWHPGFGCFVLSLWHDGACAASFRLPASAVADFVDAFVVDGDPVSRQQAHRSA